MRGEVRGEVTYWCSWPLATSCASRSGCTWRTEPTDHVSTITPLTNTAMCADYESYGGKALGVHIANFV